MVLGFSRLHDVRSGLLTGEYKVKIRPGRDVSAQYLAGWRTRFFEIPKTGAAPGAQHDRLTGAFLGAHLNLIKINYGTAKVASRFIISLTMRTYCPKLLFQSNGKNLI